MVFLLYCIIIPWFGVLLFLFPLCIECLLVNFAYYYQEWSFIPYFSNTIYYCRSLENFIQLSVAIILIPCFSFILHVYLYDFAMTSFSALLESRKGSNSFLQWVRRLLSIDMSKEFINFMMEELRSWWIGLKSPNIIFKVLYFILLWLKPLSPFLFIPHYFF